MRYLISAVAAYALYRLWPAHAFLWWKLLASLLLTVWTAVMLKAAVKRRAAEDLAAALNPRLRWRDRLRGRVGSFAIGYG